MQLGKNNLTLDNKFPVLYHVPGGSTATQVQLCIGSTPFLGSTTIRGSAIYDLDQFSDIQQVCDLHLQPLLSYYDRLLATFIMLSPIDDTV